MPTAYPTSHTLDVPGARLHYEIRGSGPLLLLIGAPMDSTGFAGIAPLLAEDYTVVTCDPRGISRSTRDDPTEDATPELLADDVHRLLSTLGTGPARVFGSSGGATTGLALVSLHPGLVHTLIAHEPPLPELLPDSAQLRAAIDDMCDTYRSHGPDAAWAKFFALSSIDGGPYAGDVEPNDADDPDPATPPTDRRTNDDCWFGHMVGPVTRFRPDISTLQHASTRIVVGGGTTSRGQLPHRGAVALAANLDTPLVEFPGGHAGFAEHPETFSRVLHGVLTSPT